MEPPRRQGRQEGKIRKEVEYCACIGSNLVTRLCLHLPVPLGVLGVLAVQFVVSSCPGGGMLMSTYALYAIKYAQRDARRGEHFYGGDPHDGPMPMDYFVWVAVSP